MENTLSIINKMQERADELKENLRIQINDFYSSESLHTEPKDFDEVGECTLNGFIKKYVEIFYGTKGTTYNWLDYPKSKYVGFFSFSKSDGFGSGSDYYNYDITYGRSIMELITNHLNSLPERCLKSIWLEFCKDVFIPCECGFSDFKQWVSDVFTKSNEKLIDDVIEKISDLNESNVETIDLRELNHDRPYKLYVFIKETMQ